MTQIESKLSIIENIMKNAQNNLNVMKTEFNKMKREK